MSAHSLTSAKKSQFMHRNSGFSTHGSRRGVNLLGWEEDENLSPEEERDCVVAFYKKVHDEIILLPKNSQKRKELGQLQAQIQKRLNELRPKKKCPGVERYFIDAVRNSVTKFQFSKYMEKAVRMKKEAEAPTGENNE